MFLLCETLCLLCDPLCNSKLKYTTAPPLSSFVRRHMLWPTAVSARGKLLKVYTKAHKDFLDSFFFFPFIFSIIPYCKREEILFLFQMTGDQAVIPDQGQIVAIQPFLGLRNNKPL